MDRRENNVRGEERNTCVMDCWGGGGGVRLVISKVKLDPRPANKCYDAGGAVISV